MSAVSLIHVWYTYSLTIPLSMYTQYSEGDRDQNNPIDDKMQDDPRPGIFEPLRDEWDRQADR